MKIKARKECNLCAAPIDSGLQRGSVKDISRNITWQLDPMECVDLLSRCCINCVRDIVHVGMDMERVGYGDKREQELKDKTARAAATYAASVLKEKAKPRRRKRREAITVYREPDTSRQELMLLLMLEASNMLYIWGDMKNKDVTSMIGWVGTSLFWKQSAHYRHLRKKYGIKGLACGRFAEWDYCKPRQEQCEGQTAFYFWRNFVAEAKDIESNLTHSDEEYYPRIESFGNYVPVWKREYKANHFRQLAPIKHKLSVFKYEMKVMRRQREGIAA